MLQLYYSPGACSLASHIALEESGAPYSRQLIDLKAGANHEPEYLRLNPKGRVPALLTDRGLITENCAILDYIARTASGKALAPVDDAYEMAQFASFNAFIASTIHPQFRIYARSPLFVNHDHPEPLVQPKVRALLLDSFGMIERKYSAKDDWVLGAKYSLCDAYLFVFSGYLRNMLGHLEGFPWLKAHRSRTAGRPAVIRALANEEAGD